MRPKDNILGTETIKRGASPPSNISELAMPQMKKNEELESNFTIVMEIDKKQSKDKSAQNITDETRREDSTSGPSTSNEKFIKNPPFFTSTSALTSSSLDNFTKAKLYTNVANTTISSSSSSLVNDKKSSCTNGDAVSSCKSIKISFKTASTLPPSSTKASATMVKHKITNNFKLPPFPVYVPSPTFSSSNLNLQSITDPSSNDNNASNNKVMLDESSSVLPETNPISTSHLSSVSSFSSGLNAKSVCSANSLSLGRINPYLYQSESSLTNNFNNVTMTTSKTSNNINNEITTSYTSPLLDQQSSYNNVSSCVTLPKLSSTNDSYVSKFSHNVIKDTSYSYKYSTDYYSNITTTNNSSSNQTSTYTSSASDNLYRVQYSATNPFLDPLESGPSSSSAETNGLSSIFSRATAAVHTSGNTNIVSQIARKFEKLDFEEDFK